MWIKRLAQRIAQPIDPWLLLFSLLLICVSLATIYSASNESVAKVTSKLVSVGVALVAMWLVANLKPQKLMALAPPIYLVGLVLLVGVALFGDITNGARRWLDIGVARIQPSELMKLAVPMMLAWYFERHEANLRFKHFGVAALLIALPMALVLKQPDLGTALLIAAAGFYALFFAGLPWRVMAGMLVVFLCSLPVVWSHMHEYQRQRVMTLIDPMTDPLGKGYHTIQGMIAIGSGGVMGKGWLSGTQTHLDFIPERTTDFIFAVYSEEFGMLGNCILLILFLCVIGRGLIIANNASSVFGRLLAGALTLSFFTYAMVNMGMVSGILPVVGVPLPLVSYGGTAMLSILIGFGMLMAIQRDRKLMKN
ncbi:rod shape-determining protein RodA [Chitinimonas sp. BJB300]|uniref:rod shape-determining protein RodA n=1 Tax=Chitinimonas sp. BJB300 TaxID=1559339 RepID=UPI000C117CF6|nr:rod shape-determining protein RodA [Chitinimonas sp. BJB300]PHV12638.1 rod shape-determining protein RodA [Chitinimonas sp. BJB300]TSJ91172.1 rod shape-determining protein RodA [Chitinimonas sp. BJB300]